MRRLLAFVVPLLLSGGPALAATPAHPDSRYVAHATLYRQPADKLPVGVTLSSVGPGKYLTTGSTLRVRGQVLNQSDGTYQRLSARLRYSGRPFTSRGELEAYSDEKGLEPQQAGPPRLISTALQAGGQQDWSLSLPVRQMGLRTFGVYPVSVEVYNAANVVVGRQRTLVTYYPKGTVAKKTKIAWVWPIVDQPHRADNSTFVDEGLERQLGGGRLADLVTAAAGTTTPVSWLVDPSLVDDAAHMADPNGYTLKSGVQRPQIGAASSWLASLRSAIGGERLIATPYADPDVMALAQHNMSKDVKLATDPAVRTLAKAGLTGATTSVAMPPDGLADQATLAALVASGSRTILLSSAILPDAQAQTFTPNPLVRKNVSGSNVKLIAYDDTLYKVLSADMSEPGKAVLAQQRFLAETAMITGERPQQSRTVVVAPPRRWSPDPVVAKTLLNYSAKAPWLQAVPLSGVEALRPVSRTFQPQKDDSGLSGSYLRQVKDLNGRIRQFNSIFQLSDSGLALGVPRAESSAWSGQSRRGAALRQTLDTELGQAAAKVKVLNNGITLVGKSARIPITISNGLSKGTVVVKLHAYSQNDTRLRVDGIDRTLTLDAGHKDQVTLDMKASANGLAYVDLELLAPDGRPFGETRVLRVRATGYGRTALLITGVSLAVLFLGVGIRVLRRRAERAEESVD
ncbi:MAG: hypothetical protein JWR24_60 [Actinoallomurus sp.]|nr:hypothetical protein [Actinoallomurus sp.]